MNVIGRGAIFVQNEWQQKSAGRLRAAMLRGPSPSAQRRPLVLAAFAAFRPRLRSIQHTNTKVSRSGPADHRDHSVPGQSPEEVERYITIPVEIAIASTPAQIHPLNTVYALSSSACSSNTERLLQRQQVINRLTGSSRAA